MEHKCAPVFHCRTKSHSGVLRVTGDTLVAVTACRWEAAVGHKGQLMTFFLRDLWTYMDGRKPPDRALEQKVLVQDESELLCWAQEWRLFTSLTTPAQNRFPSSHLSLMSSALCPLKGWKPALCGDAGLQGEAWPDRPREALRLRLLSRPRFLSPPPRLTRRRSRRPAGGGWLSSSPSSCRRVIWRGKIDSVRSGVMGIEQMYFKYSTESHSFSLSSSYKKFDLS